VQGLVRLVTKRGRELGLPAGSVLDEMVAPVIEKDKRDKKDDGKSKGKKPGDAAFNGVDVKSTRRPRAGENKCDHCILDLCQAKEWAGSTADHKSKCLVYSMVDPTKPIPHHAPSGDKAPTKTELMALTVCQMAIKKDPKLNLKTASITFCRKVSGIDENKTSSNKKIGHVATPLVSLEALQALMEEDGEISNPSMFTEWAASLGIDLAAPLIESELVEKAPAPTPVAQTPAYSWDTPQDAGLATKVSTDAVVVQVDDITNLQNELEQARAKIREQQVALQTAQDQAPAPPAAPRVRELPEHMRPFMPMTPVPSRLCTGTTVLTSGESICVWMAAITSFASIGRASSLGSTGASVTVGTGRASIAAPDRRLAKPVSTRASSAETVCRDSATTCCVIMLRRRIVTRAITLNTALTCGASWTPSLSIPKRIAMPQSRALSVDQLEDDCRAWIAEMTAWSTESGSLRTYARGHDHFCLTSCPCSSTIFLSMSACA